MLYFVVTFLKQIMLCVVMFYRQNAVFCARYKTTCMQFFLRIGGLGYLIVKTRVLVLVIPETNATDSLAFILLGYTCKKVSSEVWCVHLHMWKELKSK